MYPKYSEYERKLRYMVLLMVTKAYGKGWVANTVKGELQENVTAKARNNINRIRMEDVLEYFDLSDLEKYLFFPQEIDIAQFVENELTPEKLASLDKFQICSLIEKARRPSCLWERIFIDVGDVDEWKKFTEMVYVTRNSVAHNKKLSKQQYDETLKTLKKISDRLDIAIDTVITHEMEVVKKIDILGAFANVTEKLKLGQSEYTGMNVLLVEFGKKAKELVKPIEEKLCPEIVDAIKESASWDLMKSCDKKYRKGIETCINNDNWKNISVAIKEVKTGTEMVIDQEQINAIRIASKFEKFEV